MKLLQDMVPQEFCFQIQLNNFLSKLVVAVCKIVHIQKVTPSYITCKEWTSEGFNSPLCQSHSIYVAKNQRDWDDFIPLILFAHRTSISEAIGDPPFYCLYGREPRLPLMLNFYHQLQMTSLLQFSIIERALWKW